MPDTPPASVTLSDLSPAGSISSGPSSSQAEEDPIEKIRKLKRLRVPGLVYLATLHAAPIQKLCALRHLSLSLSLSLSLPELAALLLVFWTG